MIDRLLNEERGYSLVEVVVSILILSIAIIPMVGMFDMGINAATRASDYDKARALANLKMEEAKSLPFVDVQDNFPEGTPTPRQSRYFVHGTGRRVCELPVQDREAVHGGAAPGATGFMDLQTSAEPTGLIRVTVTVHWDDDNDDPDADLSDDKTYTTSGLVAQ